MGFLEFVDLDNIDGGERGRALVLKYSGKPSHGNLVRGRKSCRFSRFNRCIDAAVLMIINPAPTHLIVSVILVRDIFSLRIGRQRICRPLGNKREYLG